MSKGFSMIDGDVVVTDTIELTDNKELLRQKVERVIGTNLGEWAYDIEEGIDYSVILCKNPDKDKIRATIEQALQHIDNGLVMTDFSLVVEGRRATITFQATDSSGETLEVTYTYAN